MRIRCLQHVAFEGPALIEGWALARGHTLETTPWFEEPASEVPEDFDLLVSLGGPMSALDEREHPWIGHELRVLERSIARGRPTLGICLGAQLMARVLGGRIARADRAEIGWHPVETVAETEPGVRLPRRFVPLHWHRETFEIPPGAHRLAASSACRNQGFAQGSAVGLQFHLEATPQSTAQLVAASRADLVGGGGFVQSEAEILGRPSTAFAELGRVAFDFLDGLATPEARTTCPDAFRL